MEAFYVIANLKLPPAFTDSLPTLDALLASAIHMQTGSIEKAHANIPLSMTDDVWNGSIGQFDVDTIPHTIPVVKSIGACTENTPDKFRPKTKVYGQLNIKKGELQNVMRKNTAWTTASKTDLNATVLFSGHGDMEQCFSLLSENILHLGSLRKFGFGAIESWEIHPVEKNRDRSLIRPDGNPARPMPIDTWKNLSAKKVPVQLCGFAPSYWDSTRYTLCAVPPPKWGLRS